MSRAVHSLPLLAAIVVLAIPASATASPDAVIRDCARDGKLDKQYSNKDLRGALDDLPSDLDEYSDCREVIGGAIKGGSDRGGGRASAGGAGATPDEQAARGEDSEELAALTEKYSGGDGKPPRIDVGGKTVEPGSNGLFDIASASNSLPLPLLLAMIALGLVATMGGLAALRSRIPALGRIPVLSKISLPSVRFPSLFRR